MTFPTYFEMLRAVSESFPGTDLPRERLQKLIPYGVELMFDFNKCSWEEGRLFERRYKKNFRGWFDRFCDGFDNPYSRENYEEIYYHFSPRKYRERLWEKQNPDR